MFVDSPNKRQCLQDLNALSPPRDSDRSTKIAVPAEDTIGSKLAL